MAHNYRGEEDTGEPPLNSMSSQQQHQFIIETTLLLHSSLDEMKRPPKYSYRNDLKMTDSWRSREEGEKSLSLSETHRRHEEEEDFVQTQHVTPL